MRGALAGLLAVVVSVAAVGQVRDVDRPVAGTATLAGTVVIDDGDGAPVKRALVVVTPSRSVYRPSEVIQTTTDDAGRFVVTGLPASNVRVIASKPGHPTTTYGARQPGSPTALPVALSDGQTTTITVRLARGAVITGVVRDEQGQPMPGVGIRVQRVTMTAMGQRLLSATSGALVPTTDDRGAYRVYGLAAGSYVVSAQPRLSSGEVRQTTAEELQWAERQTRPGAAAAVTAFAGAAAEVPEPGRPITYAAVYFPGTLNAATAGIVSVAAGQERAGVDLRMQFVPTARVSGTVTGADSLPARGVQVMLLPEVDGADQDAARQLVLLEAGLFGGSGSGTAGADGSFSLAGVAPGRYALVARSPAPGRGGGAAAGAEVSSASVDVVVDGRDIDGLALRLVPGQRVSGRFVFESRAASARPPSVSVTLRAATARGLTVTLASPTSSGDAFSIAGVVPSLYRIVAMPAGWMLKSAMLDGRDLADTAIEVRPGLDVSDLVLTFTDTPAEVSGTLYDGAGRPTSDLSLVFFATDRALWFTGSRRVRPAVRPSSDGRFVFSGLVAGEYFLAAVTDVSPADLADPAFLEELTATAIRIAIADGEKKTQDVRIAR